MEKVNFKIEMTNSPTSISTREYKQEITGIDSLKKEIKISPKAFVTLNKSGFKAEFFVDTISVLIGIGKDYTADLIMTKDAWEALCSGEEVNITTLKEFKEQFVDPKDTQEIGIFENPLDKHSVQDWKNIRNTPIRYHLIDCLKDLKFGRPGSNQKMLDKWIKELEENLESGKPFV